MSFTSGQPAATAISKAIAAVSLWMYVFKMTCRALLELALDPRPSSSIACSKFGAKNICLTWLSEVVWGEGPVKTFQDVGDWIHDELIT